MKPRQCGTCRACCTTMAVNEISKPANVACAHLEPDAKKARACTIYDTRPPSCAAWSCLWLRFHDFDAERRPDRLGVVFDVTAKDFPGGQAWLAFEVWPGAFLDARGLLEKISASVAVVLMHTNGTRTVLCKDELKMAVIQARVAEESERRHLPII